MPLFSTVTYTKVILRILDNSFRKKLLIILQIAKQKLDCQIQSLDYKYGRNSRVIVEAIIHEKLTILFHYKICFNLQPAGRCRWRRGGGCWGRLLLGRSQRFSEESKAELRQRGAEVADGPKSHSSILHPPATIPSPATQLYLAAFTGCGQAAAAAAAAGSVITDGHKYFSVSPPDIFLSRCRCRGQVGVVCQSSVVTIIAAR